MGSDLGAELKTTEDASYCARHPQVETYLRCGRCDTPICPRCLVQTPVGARCPDCAKVGRLPTMVVSPAYFFRGLGAGWLAGVATGAAWGYISGGNGGFGLGFFVIFLAMGIGWAVSEAVSFATNRKRGIELQLCAAMGVVIAFLVRNAVIGIPLLPQGDPWAYIAAGFAIVFAWSRLSRF